MLFKIIKDKKAVSMPELMASITIMAILAGTGARSAINQIAQAKVVSTMNEMKLINSALTDYHKDYPGYTITTITTLVTQGYLSQGFVRAPNQGLKTNWKKDAWGNEYKLISPYIESDGDFVSGFLESAGKDGEFTDNPVTTNYNESADNIKIILEPMVDG